MFVVRGSEVSEVERYILSSKHASFFGAFSAIRLARISARVYQSSRLGWGLLENIDDAHDTGFYDNGT
jgi:hypothetical protein